MANNAKSLRGQLGLRSSGESTFFDTFYILYNLRNLRYS